MACPHHPVDYGPALPCSMCRIDAHKLREQTRRREYTALEYYQGVVAVTDAIEYLDKRGRLDDDVLAILHCACQDVQDAWKAAQQRDRK